MRPIAKSKKHMRLPENGAPVKIKSKILPNEKCGGFFVKEKHIQCRRKSENGVYC